MNKIFVICLFFASAQAFAQDNAASSGNRNTVIDFSTAKGRLLAQQREKIMNMQSDLACIEAAENDAAIKACQQESLARYRKYAQQTLKQVEQRAPNNNQH